MKLLRSRLARLDTGPQRHRGAGPGALPGVPDRAGPAEPEDQLHQPEHPVPRAAASSGSPTTGRCCTTAQLRASIEFTLALAVAVTVVANVAGLGFAVLLNRTSLSYRVLRTLAFLPQVISGIIVGFVWSWMLSPTGLVNHILTGTGLVSQPVNWLGTPQLAQLSAGIVVSWVLSGFTTVVYLAALQNIPRELYEASSIDGANSRQQFRMITFRMVAPATTISVVICLITVLKLYDIITALTGGGPAYATRSIAMYIISVGFSNDAYGYASAIAMVLLVLTAIIALSVTTVLRRREVDL